MLCDLNPLECTGIITALCLKNRRPHFTENTYHNGYRHDSKRTSNISAQWLLIDNSHKYIHDRRYSHCRSKRLNQSQHNRTLKFTAVFPAGKTEKF